MRPSVVFLMLTLPCIFCTARAEELEPLTAAEIEEELAVVRTYLDRDMTKQEPDGRPGESFRAVEAAGRVLRSIGDLPEESMVRLNAIAFARKHANIPIPVDVRKQELSAARRAHMRLTFSWAVLRKTGVLRDGMRLEELVALLGMPTKIGPETAEWYYSSRMHVNPCLRYWRTTGRHSPEKKEGMIEVTRY